MTKCPECLLSEKDFNLEKEKKLNSSRWMNSDQVQNIQNSTYEPQVISSQQVVYNNYPVSPHQYLCHLNKNEEKNKEDERINGLTLNSNNNFIHNNDSEEDEEEEEEQFKDLDPSKKRKFIPILKWASMGNIKVDYDYLKENNYDNMEKLYAANINIQEIYWYIGVDQWKDLIDKLNFSKDYLKNGELYPIKFLVSKYSISYEDLVTDLDMKLSDFIEFQFTSNELKSLNLNLNNLITDFSIKKKDIIKFGFKINEWYYNLGMNFDNLFPLNFSIEDYQKAKWRQSLIKNFLNLTEKQIDILGLSKNTNSNSNSKKLRKKKTKNN